MSGDEQAVRQSCERIQAAAPDFVPRVGVVLGSGLGAFAEAIDPVATLPYEELPGFPRASVGGHHGQLCLGRVGSAPVAVLKGRAHYFEAGQADAMRVPIDTLATLGCEILILTNAAGSLLYENGPGSVVLVSDHLNMTGVSPLFGEEGDGRFVAMGDAYDPELRRQLQAVAKAREIKLSEGVYAWMSGPQFETPAEIRMLRTLGAELVGMSTVPEVILARHRGLRVAAVSVITNLAAGMTEAPLSHEQTLDYAGRAAADLRLLLLDLLWNNQE